MVPRTSNGVADHEPLREWAMIMRAVSPDREKVATAPGQQYLFSTDMPEQRGSFRQLVLRNAKGKIGTTEFRTVRHFFTLKGVGRVADDASSTSR
jgi:hypothetical protein